MKLFLSIWLGIITGLLWIYWLSLQDKAQASWVKQEVTHDITHKWRPKDSIVQEYVRYAYKISWGDLDFVATLESENGTRDPKKQSNVHQYYDKEKWKNVMCNKANWNAGCKREESFWFCQMMKKFHPQVNDKRFFTDPKRQIETCYAKYKWWTKFYWFNVRHKVIWRFETKVWYAWKVEAKQSVVAVINTYEIARQASIKRQNAEKELIVAQDNFEKSVQNEVKTRWDCKNDWTCKE